MPVVVVGNVFVDFKGFPEGSYIPGGRNAGRVEIVHGGVGRNVAEDIANVELRPRFVSMVDNTAQGAEVLRKLQNHKVDTKYIAVVPDGMGIWLAVMDSSGDVVASISKRPQMDAMLKMLEEQGDAIFSDATSVVIEVDIDKEVAKLVFRFSEKYGVPVYALVANMSIALQRRDLIQRTHCFICNVQEAGIFFADDFSALSPEEMAAELLQRIQAAGIRSMVVTMGARGAVYAEADGSCGVCPAIQVHVCDTSGAGDAFCAGVSIGLSYGKTLGEACVIGTRLASATITVPESVCPRFQPEELGLKIQKQQISLFE
ncbi:MAG: carbohydrate kinase family protein [Oscillospiraceae bacterium]|nr:carbohydrate kinase family protein [Oscillospiraceae bacterium]